MTKFRKVSETFFWKHVAAALFKPKTKFTLQVFRDKFFCLRDDFLFQNSLGGSGQAAASLRGSLVCCTDFILSPPGIALKWLSALALHRAVFISDQVRAAHTRMVDLICTSHRALGRASKWHVSLGDESWGDFQTLAAKRVSQKRTSEIRTILHATEHGLPKYGGATNVTSLQEFLESLKRLDRGSSLMGMCKR
jgi:hypothetical protein